MIVELIVVEEPPVVEHASLGCACGWNMLGEWFTDPICQVVSDAET